MMPWRPDRHAWGRLREQVFGELQWERPDQGVTHTFRVRGPHVVSLGLFRLVFAMQWSCLDGGWDASIVSESLLKMYV